MLEHCLQWLFLSSVTGGIFILAALVLRSCLKHILPKSFLVKLWAAVLLGFLFAAWLPSPTSIHNFIKLKAPQLQESTSGASREAMAHPPAAPSRTASPPAVQSATGIAARDIVFAVWLAGMLALLVYFLVAYMRTARLLHAAVPINDTPFIREWLQEKNATRVSVRLSGRFAAPVSFGIFRPVIVLPETLDLRDAPLLRGILEHELIHGRNMHNLLKALVYLVVAVHWFNPLAWVYLFLFSHDAELACDEKVIRNLGRGKRADYARSLLSIAVPPGASPRLLSPFSAKNIKERVVNIMAYEPAGFGMRALELAIVVATFAVFGTVAASGRAGNGGSGTPLFVAARGETAKGILGEYLHAAALAASGGGTIINGEMEIVGGIPEYEFTIVLDGMEHEISLDGRTLRPVSHNKKQSKEFPHDLAKAELLSAQQAGEIAARAVGGGEVTGFSLDYEAKSSGFIYEFEIFLDGKEYDVEVDAKSGLVSDIGVDT